MNNWDYYLLGQLVYWLLITIFFTVILLLTCKGIMGICKFLREEFLLFSNPILFIKKILYGDVYAIRINGIWSSCRTKYRLDDNVLYIKYGPFKHGWFLKLRDWKDLGSRMNEEEIEKFLIKRNLYDLNQKYNKNLKTKEYDERPYYIIR